MVIDDKLINDLLDKAAASERLRVNLDLRNSPADQSQRMLNALLPGTVLPIHRHRSTAETVFVIKGALTEIFYDESGNVTARHRLDPAAGCYGLQVPAGQWHTVEVHAPTVIVECKDGPYAPLSPDDTLCL